MDGQSTRAAALARLHAIVEGIDQDEIDGGWWETSVGVEFGTGKLSDLEGLITDLT
jgi:hypothetical protein